jgi:hypothetical protein
MFLFHFFLSLILSFRASFSYSPTLLLLLSYSLLLSHCPSPFSSLHPLRSPSLLLPLLALNILHTLCSSTSHLLAQAVKKQKDVYLFVEGFLLYSFPTVVSRMDKKIFLSITQQTCFRRRFSYSPLLLLLSPFSLSPSLSSTSLSFSLPHLSPSLLIPHFHF